MSEPFSDCYADCRECFACMVRNNRDFWLDLYEKGPEAMMSALKSLIDQAAQVDAREAAALIAHSDDCTSATWRGTAAELIPLLPPNERPRPDAGIRQTWLENTDAWKCDLCGDWGLIVTDQGVARVKASS